MQRIFFNLFLLSISWSLALALEESPCERTEELIDGKCVDVCVKRKVCGENTTCKTSFQTVCSCQKGFTGNPLNGCFKLNEESPCEPSPCGPNSECIAKDAEIGPHCRCKKGFYDWAPTCREGCGSDSECGPTQVCTYENNCEELCDPSRCGENSICRVDKKKKSIHCSCKDGYMPETSVGCRLKTEKDFDIDVDMFSNILYDKCGGICGDYAYCGPENQCICSEGYLGNPLVACSRITGQNSEEPNPCIPNPCSAFSTCNAVNETEAKCTCLKGYGTSPYCSKCFFNLACPAFDICSEGRCVFNVCKPYCGDRVGCNIHDGKLECNCNIQAINSASMPYLSCPDIAFLSSSVIAVLSG